MMRYLKQYKFLLFLTVLFTAISSLSYVFITILLQQVMDIVDMGDMDGFIRILLFSLAYFALMGVFMYLQSLFSKIFVCKIMKAVRSKTFKVSLQRHNHKSQQKPSQPTLKRRFFQGKGGVFFMARFWKGVVLT